MANIPIDAVRLPTDVERGAIGGPLFNTVSRRTDGGQVSTNRNWDYPLFRGQVAYGIQSSDTLDVVIAFFWARRGRWRGFLFRDWSDYKATGQLLGTGDGVEEDFPVKKTYPDGVLPFVRPITRPVESTMTVYADGIPLSLAAWSLSAGGIVHISTPPANAVVITADFEFDIPVQFDTDQLVTRMELDEIGAIPDLPIFEVRE